MKTLDTNMLDRIEYQLLTFASLTEKEKEKKLKIHSSKLNIYF